MANRKNTFILKRSNVPGKVPTSGDLILGELAINTADVILYASGTTANSILPIGWDRVARTGDTMTGTLYAPTISATTISATSLNVDGSFKLANGTQGGSRILTSDANGVGTWQYPSVAGNYALFFKNTASDIGGYLQAVTDVQTGPIQTITNLNVSADTILATFASASGGTGLSFFPAGIVTLHIHAANTNSGKQTQLYFQLYRRTSGGTETLLGTSSYTAFLANSESEYTTDLSITATTASTTDRIVIRVLANVTGVGTAPNIDLYIEDATLSRIQLPAPVVNSTNYVPYTGASSDVNLGVYNLRANSITATTYYGLPIDVTVTGISYDNINKFTLTNNTGGTFSSSITNLFTSGNIGATAISATTISATTYQNLPIDVYTTGGTYNAGTGIATFRNNTGGTFTVSGFNSSSAATASYITGFTYNNANTFTLTDNSGATLSASINIVTGLTVNGNISVTGTSDFQGNFISSIIPNTNRTLSLGDGTHIWQTLWSQYVRLADNSGNDVILISAPVLASSPDPAWEMVMPAQSGATYSLLGVYSGASNVSNTTWFNLSAGTNVTLTQSGNISGGTLAISSQDTTVTGGTYTNGTATFTNNTGGTFTVTGFTSADTFVTGVTISNGTLSLLRNQGQSTLTASTKTTRELTFNSNEMTLGTATRLTLSPLIMAVTRFDGTGAIDDAGLSFVIPNDYSDTPQFYFTWRASSTAATQTKIFLELYTGSTNELGSLVTPAETLTIIDTPTNTNTFLFSSAATSSISFSGGNIVHARIYRDPSDGGDTYTGTLDMITLNFKYNSIS